jgi:hypothetical protein
MSDAADFLSSKKAIPPDMRVAQTGDLLSLPKQAWSLPSWSLNGVAECLSVSVMKRSFRPSDHFATLWVMPIDRSAAQGIHQRDLQRSLLMRYRFGGPKRT